MPIVDEARKAFFQQIAAQVVILLLTTSVLLSEMSFHIWHQSNGSGGARRKSLVKVRKKKIKLINGGFFVPTLTPQLMGSGSAS